MKKKAKIEKREASGDLDDAREELELFRRAMAGVERMRGGAKRAPASSAPRVDRERIEGGLSNLDPPAQPRAPGAPNLAPKDRRLLKRLRRGGFPVEEDLDLHGMTREEARRELDSFLDEAVARGFRCVRIVHGVGWNSPNRESVLRRKVPEWLADPSNATRVMAFTSARPRDGGSGAVYVLLRKREERRVGREGESNQKSGRGG